MLRDQACRRPYLSLPIPFSAAAAIITPHALTSVHPVTVQTASSSVCWCLDCFPLPLSWCTRRSVLFFSCPPPFLRLDGSTRTRPVHYPDFVRVAQPLNVFRSPPETILNQMKAGWRHDAEQWGVCHEHHPISVFTGPYHAFLVSRLPFTLFALLPCHVWACDVLFIYFSKADLLPSSI